jgi:hypothetical protein
MTKLLTAIILLCFSVAANADIYFCNPSIGGTVADDIGETTDHETTSFIIDTEKGFREIGPVRNNADYVGNCFIQTLTILCSASLRSGGTIGGTISLQMSSNEPYGFSFTLPLLQAGLPAFLIAMVGTCTKA